MFNNNFKNNYYPTDLNLSSESKKNINSVANFEPKINLICLKNNSNFNSNNKKNNCIINNKDETIEIDPNETKEIKINNIYNIEIQHRETKYKLKYSKSLNDLISKKFKINNLSSDNININLNNRSGIYFISQNNLINKSFDTKIKFGFKYDKIPINKMKIKHNIQEKQKSKIDNKISF
jgi:hypothetical protein